MGSRALRNRNPDNVNLFYEQFQLAVLLKSASELIFQQQSKKSQSLKFIYTFILMQPSLYVYIVSNKLKLMCRIILKIGLCKDGNGSSMSDFNFNKVDIKGVMSGFRCPCNELTGFVQLPGYFLPGSIVLSPIQCLVNTNRPNLIIKTFKSSTLTRR